MNYLMGCDIHYTIEKIMEDGTWELINRDNIHQIAKNRNYNRFSNLCGVRGYNDKEPNGIPKDVSRGSKLYIDEYGSDGHSHGYISLKDIISIFKKSDDESGIKFEEWESRCLCWHYFELDGVESEEGFEPWSKDHVIDRYRVVYFFDN